MKKPSQIDRILEYNREHGSITALQAMEDLGIMRLASRIADIRRLGYTVKTSKAHVNNRYGERCWVSKYEIVGEPICVQR